MRKPTPEPPLPPSQEHYARGANGTLLPSHAKFMDSRATNSDQFYYKFHILIDRRASRLLATAQAELLQTKAGSIALHLKATEKHLKEQNVFTEFIVAGLLPSKDDLLRLLKTTTENSPFTESILEF